MQDSKCLEDFICIKYFSNLHVCKLAFTCRLAYEMGKALTKTTTPVICKTFRILLAVKKSVWKVLLNFNQYIFVLGCIRITYRVKGRSILKNSFGATINKTKHTVFAPIEYLSLLIRMPEDAYWAHCGHCRQKIGETLQYFRTKIFQKSKKLIEHQGCNDAGYGICIWNNSSPFFFWFFNQFLTHEMNYWILFAFLQMILTHF